MLLLFSIHSSIPGSEILDKWVFVLVRWFLISPMGIRFNLTINFIPDMKEEVACVRENWKTVQSSTYQMVMT